MLIGIIQQGHGVTVREEITHRTCFPRPSHAYSISQIETRPLLQLTFKWILKVFNQGHNTQVLTDSVNTFPQIPKSQHMLLDQALATIYIYDNHHADINQTGSI